MRSAYKQIEWNVIINLRITVNQPQAVQACQRDGIGEQVVHKLDGQVLTVSLNYVLCDTRPLSAHIFIPSFTMKRRVILVNAMVGLGELK